MKQIEERKKKGKPKSSSICNCKSEWGLNIPGKRH